MSLKASNETEYIPDYESYDYESAWRWRSIEDRAERTLVGDLVEPGYSGLELGGGYGRITAVVEGSFQKMFMVDYSKKNLSKASERLAKTKLVRASISRLPFHDNSFDSVLAIRVLHHVPDLERMMGEIARVARDRASVIIGVPNTRGMDGPAENALVATGPQGHRVYAAPLSAYSHESLERTEVRGLGIFDNRLGRRLRSLSQLAALDVATSSVWSIKPQLFIKFRARKSGRSNEPVVICRCGLELVRATCGGCGVQDGRIIELADPVN